MPRVGSGAKPGPHEDFYRSLERQVERRMTDSEFEEAMVAGSQREACALHLSAMPTHRLLSIYTAHLINTNMIGQSPMANAHLLQQEIDARIPTRVGVV